MPTMPDQRRRRCWTVAAPGGVERRPTRARRPDMAGLGIRQASALNACRRRHRFRRRRTRAISLRGTRPRVQGIQLHPEQGARKDSGGAGERTEIKDVRRERAVTSAYLLCTCRRNDACYTSLSACPTRKVNHLLTLRRWLIPWGYVTAQSRKHLVTSTTWTVGQGHTLRAIGHRGMMHDGTVTKQQTPPILPSPWSARSSEMRP
jgi:hypothetical protein